jgi:hypothetical protein
VIFDGAHFAVAVASCTSSHRISKKQQNCITTPRQLKAMQGLPKTEDTDNRGKEINGTYKHGIKQLDINHHNHNLRWPRVQAVLYANPWMQANKIKTRHAEGTAKDHQSAEVVTSLLAKYGGGHRCMTNKQQESRHCQHTISNKSARLAKLMLPDFPVKFKCINTKIGIACGN